MKVCVSSFSQSLSNFVAWATAVFAGVLIAGPAWSQAIPNPSINLDLPISSLLNAPSLGLGAQIELNLDSTSLSAEILGGRVLDIDLTVPAGFVLREVSCPAGVSLSVNGSASVVGTGTGLADCVLSIVDVASASAAAVPAILQRNDFLLSVELGLSQQLDRFGGDSSSNDEFPKPSGLGVAPAPGDWNGGERMGLLSSGGTASSNMAFSTSLQQTQRAAPSMLGANTRAPERTISRSFNVWTEGYLARTESDIGGESDGHTAVIYAGADYLLSPYLLLGALVQYDDQDRKFDDAPLKYGENGWLAGPYAVVRLSDSVFFQTRAAWGQSENKMRFDGVFDDSFDSDRWLVKGRLLANIRSGSWLVRPSASIAYIEDHLEAYRSSSGIDVAGRTVSLGQLKFGPEIAYSFAPVAGVSVTPSLTLEGIWNFDQDVGASGFDDLAVADDVRGRVEAGATIQTARGVSLGVAASYDGIGTSDFSALGGRARLNVPLN